MIPETLHIPLIKLITQNFTSEEVDLLGKYFEPKFNAHLLSGEPFGLTLQPEQAARTIVKHFAQKNRLHELIVLLIHTNENSSVVRRSIKIQGLNEFLQKMGGMGLVYNSASDTITQKAAGETDTWGYLEEGASYNFAFLSIDIAGNSVIQSKYPKQDIEEVYTRMYKIIEGTVKHYNGKIWTWAGDGGIAAFYLGNITEDAVNSAINIQTRMIPFNLSSRRNKFHEPIHLRIASHQGPTMYKENKGAILSEAINYVAHLEKKGTAADAVAISKEVYDELNERYKKIFKYKGVFEEKDTYEISFRMDWMEF
ncbi:MAG: hypothetical protein OEZ34_09600 [Spirochaetia bacterium]|nr:hypothetical protein [Spirochaetia bacterium]